MDFLVDKLVWAFLPRVSVYAVMNFLGAHDTIDLVF